MDSYETITPEPEPEHQPDHDPSPAPKSKLARAAKAALTIVAVPCSSVLNIIIRSGHIKTTIEAPADLNDMTVAELNRTAKALDITDRSGLKKSGLVDKIMIRLGLRTAIEDTPPALE